MHSLPFSLEWILSAADGTTGEKTLSLESQERRMFASKQHHSSSVVAHYEM
jgi:hypothetical protein